MGGVFVSPWLWSGNEWMSVAPTWVEGVLFGWGGGRGRETQGKRGRGGSKEGMSTLFHGACNWHLNISKYTPFANIELESRYPFWRLNINTTE